MSGPCEGESDMETYNLVQLLAAQGVADVSVFDMTCCCLARVNSLYVCVCGVLLHACAALALLSTDRWLCVTMSDSSHTLSISATQCGVVACTDTLW